MKMVILTFLLIFSLKIKDYSAIGKDYSSVSIGDYSSLDRFLVKSPSLGSTPSVTIQFILTYLTLLV